MKKIIPLLFIMAILSSCRPYHKEEQVIWGDWEFRGPGDRGAEILGDGKWYPASVPGTVHTDLLACELIPDPFFGENEKELQWIGEEEWEYRNVFFINPLIQENENIELVFEGLDTYAKVFLNDEMILEADNMFRTWTVNIKEQLLEERNELVVRFFPPGEINERKAAALSYKLPDDRAFTRKSPYHFGWDWGPEYVTCGLWKPAYLRAWSEYRIANVHIEYSGVDHHPLPVGVHVEVISDGDYEVMIEVLDDYEERVAFEKVELIEGLNEFTLHAEIDDPKLWWPAGLGKQHLYSFRTKVIKEGISVEKITTFGLRDIELIREPDKEGETFYFTVNGLPVFMKGANYVPQDNFLPRVDTARYEQLIQSVLDANMNMLRVWGGGFYENDLFYNLCDQNGILLWQDFMFACTMYPGDSTFLANVKQEAIDNVKRLSNHPSIALWCGNNEVDEGWHNWGWQQALGYSYEDSAKVWNDYLAVFHDILPEVVGEYDPGTIYHPSSPMTGWGRDEAYKQGDVHYWGVWWGEYPFWMYKAKVGRFVSEYGFQGMPPMETIESFGGLISPQPPAPSPQVLEAHQKHPRGTELIQKYMEREFIIPEKFEDYVYISQVLQAEGMAQAFLTHRIRQPYCMGTLYWQLNDCWPVTSWSGLDYYGRWKALHYHVKRAYEPLMIHAHIHDGITYLFVVNDSRDEKEVVVKSELMDFNGKVLEMSEKKLKAPPLSSYLADTISADHEGNDRLVYARLVINDTLISRSYGYYAPAKDMPLPRPGLSWEVSGNTIRIKTDKLARQIFLEARGLVGRFPDNFFDMAPGETRILEFLGIADSNELSDRLEIKSIYDTYN